MKPFLFSAAFQVLYKNYGWTSQVLVPGRAGYLQRMSPLKCCTQGTDTGLEQTLTSLQQIRHCKWQIQTPPCSQRLGNSDSQIWSCLWLNHKQLLSYSFLHKLPILGQHQYSCKYCDHQWVFQVLLPLHHSCYLQHKFLKLKLCKENWKGYDTSIKQTYFFRTSTYGTATTIIKRYGFSRTIWRQRLAIHRGTRCSSII